MEQNERLRLVLQEQRKQHLASLVKKIEAKTSTLLRQKDEEIAQILTYVRSSFDNHAGSVYAGEVKRVRNMK